GTGSAPRVMLGNCEMADRKRQDDGQCKSFHDAPPMMRSLGWRAKNPAARSNLLLPSSYMLLRRTGRVKKSCVSAGKRSSRKMRWDIATCGPLLSVLRLFQQLL